MYLLGECGIPQVPVRIYNGDETDTSLWPWLVTILYVSPKTQQGKVICSGALISPEWVLTAAHCFDHSRDVSRYRLASGNSESLPRDSTIDAFVQTRRVG